MRALAQTLMTVDEFLATAEEREGRWEIENGVAYAMAPERAAHARVKSQTFMALWNAVKRAGLWCEAMPDSIAVRIAAHTAYQPDALVYCGPRIKGGVREIANPVIVVEVTSPATGWRDAGKKFTGYFSVPSVMHYLMMHPDDRVLVHHKRAEGGLTETRIYSEGAVRLGPPGLDLTISDLFGEA